MQAEVGTPLTTDTTPVARETKVSPRHLGVLALLAVLAYGADQLSKIWALKALASGEPRDFIGSLLRLHLTFNPGAAFSFATNATWVLTLIAIAVVIGVLVTARKLRSFGWASAMGLLVGGALGNLTDRFIRPPGGGQGHVVDFLQLPNWPIFNLADCVIVCAAGMIVLLSLRGIGLDGVKDSDRTQKETT